jgi:hypothetical protein
MNNSLSMTTEQTMTSLELRNIINAARVEYGETEVENRKLLMRIEDELVGELSVGQVFRPTKGGTPQRYYDLTKNQGQES